MSTRSSAATSWRRMMGAGAWAVADQGLFAVSNLILSVLLSRWLPSAEYGAFATAFAVFLLASTFHTAMLAEPALILGGGKYREALRPYLRQVARLHWASSLVLAVLLLAIALVVALAGHRDVAVGIAA